jgi:hypothetical protein
MGRGPGQASAAAPGPSSAGGREKHSCRDAPHVGDGISRSGRLSSERREIRPQGAGPHAQGSAPPADRCRCDRESARHCPSDARCSRCSDAARTGARFCSYVRSRSRSLQRAIWLPRDIACGGFCLLPCRKSPSTRRRGRHNPALGAVLGFTMEAIATQLGVSQRQISRDLESLDITSKPSRPKGGRPKPVACLLRAQRR